MTKQEERFMKTINIPVPVKRVRCIVCSKPLVRGGKFDDLNVCTTEGSIVLTCSAHATIGDKVVQAVQIYAKKDTIHSRVGTTAEGVAFLCLNFDADRHNISTDMKLSSPVLEALLVSTTDETKVTCLECRRILRL